MHPFRQYIHRFQHIPDQTWNIILENSRTINLSKGDLFHREGKTCKKVGFILSGVMRTYITNPDGTEYTKHFLQTDSFVIELQSFRDQVAGVEYIEALSECTLIVFTYDQVTFFEQTLPNWLDIKKQITEKALLEVLEIRNQFLQGKATKRYQDFVTQFPQIVQHAPVGAIASFLGITIQSLSRIRKNLVHQ